MTTEFQPPPGSVDEAAGAVPSGHPAADLRAVVVEYDDRPDRCTVCPRRLSRDQLTTAWLTADASAFWDLAEAR